MNETIILSKIARILNEQQTDSESKAITFSFKNKQCVLLDQFKDDAQNIQELLNLADKFGRKEFAFVSIGKEQHLVFLYKNPTRMKNDAFIENLTAVVYPNLKNSFSFRKIKKISLNTYVTTKLFEALHIHNIQHLRNENKYMLSLPAKFLPTLREYQKNGVLWMLKRELEQDRFPPIFEKLLAKDNETVVYKELYSNFVQINQPDDIILPPGGILADEMGLGKTVEMLALIMLNSSREDSLNPALRTFFSAMIAKRLRSENKLFCICDSSSMKNIIQCQKCNLWQHQQCVNFYDSEIDVDGVSTAYICPGCWHNVTQEYGLLKTKATFIVSPNTIKMQWTSEIKCHIQPSLRVFLYEGVSSGKWISPLQLAEYDVVITDYNILRGDIYYTQDNATERITRNKPRRMRVNTPILMLEWWRVVLDEAQMVKSNQSKVASLVRMLPAINRWAVTGTPIQKSLDDLLPLLQFIGFDAVSQPFFWHHIVNDFVKENNFKEANADTSCFTMINILQKCMWRTCKTNVLSELDIPPQQEVIHRIQFDNLEELFYNEQHVECQNKFLENVFKCSQRMSTISPQVMNIILQPFLKIRQSCTIPVVMAAASAKNNFNSHQQKRFLKPQELNAYLKSTNENSCKSELRAMASSHNGLAGLYILEEKFELAINNYEAVLKLAKDYSDLSISVDSLLQIHALHNIMQIKIIQDDASAQNLEPYDSLYNQLEWKYLSTYASSLATAKNAYEAVLEKVNSNISDNFMINMADGIKTLLDNDESILIQKIQDECIPRFLNQGNKIVQLNEIRTTRTLLYVIELWFQKLNEILRTLKSDIEQLKYFTENVRSRNQVSPAIWRDISQLVFSVYNCHLSEIMNDNKSTKETQNTKATPKKKKLCKMCCIRDSINTFECLLFDKVLDKNTNYTEGLENPSLEMYLCKLTFHYIKHKYHHLNNIMEQNWLYLENLQLVCKRLIKLWIEMEYMIKAYDELNMCKMRITLTDDIDDKSIFKIVENDIAGRIIEQQNDLMSAQNQFRIKLARLKYIKHLEGNDDTGPCPICRLAGNDKYAVLECGHHICFPCLKSIRLYVKSNYFKCSICRNVQQNEKIYYVSRAKNKNTDAEPIKGHYSSKITYIVRLILKLHKEKYETERVLENNIEANDVKILIFSQWEPIIQAIALALKENDIKYRAQCTPKSIEEFKNPELGITCLLMPFVRGSKGLNLVEATHVFLVEPILNPGEELQAIGRVHRIGQKRVTTVHRFIVNKTIEENIYNFIISSSSNSNSTTTSGIQSKWEFDNISLKDFENLFSLPETIEML